MSKLYRLDIDEVFSNLSLFTNYDIGNERQGIIVEKEKLDIAIHEIVSNFKSLIEESFEPYEEGEE